MMQCPEALVRSTSSTTTFLSWFRGRGVLGGKLERLSVTVRPELAKQVREKVEGGPFETLRQPAYKLSASPCRIC
jgi:hypothetical protein